MGGHCNVKSGYKPRTLEEAACHILDRSTGSGSDECWVWNGAKSGRGYGRIYYGGKLWFTHRLMYVAACGDIPAGKLVCHKCDNPACCNPSHFFIGTHKDNTADCVRKGRSKSIPPRLGMAHYAAKITDQDVRYIRDNPDGLTMAALARKIKCTESLINHVVHRRSWKHLK